MCTKYKICFFVRIDNTYGKMSTLQSFFFRGISNQGLKHEYGKRRLSRDLMVSKDVLSLKTREGKFLISYSRRNVE